MPNGWRTIKSLVHKIWLHGRRGKGMASFSREKLRHATQKEGGWKIPCDLPPVWPRLVRPLMTRMNGKKTHTLTGPSKSIAGGFRFPLALRAPLSPSSSPSSRSDNASPSGTPRVLRPRLRRVGSLLSSVKPVLSNRFLFVCLFYEGQQTRQNRKQ